VTGSFGNQTVGTSSGYIASTFEDEPYRAKVPVLRRLNAEFALLALARKVTGSA